MNKKLEIVNLESFDVAGLTIRTSNQEALRQPVIPLFWKRFMDENICEKIPGKVDSHLMYGVYTDYENNVNGQYTLLIGARVDSSKNFALGKLEKKTIYGGQYAVFSAPSKDQILNTWMRIWETPLERAYTSDFELYDLASSLIKIYIAIK